MLTLADLTAVLAPDFAVEGAAGIDISGVCIDSRQAAPGVLFVALKGEHNDGHAYVAQAYAKGARVALVERPVEGATLIDTLRGEVTGTLATPVAIVVPDALQALQHLAQAARSARPDLRVIGVTGSVGKTTTKETIAAVLAQRYRTLKSIGNYNNEIGLPLTLMVLQPEHERAVLEMGMYSAGEIAALCHLARPQVGVVTNVFPVHLERLGSIERIAQAKCELVEALPKGGTAILNGDDPYVREMSARAQARGAEVVTFGMQADNTVCARAIENEGFDGVRFVAHVAVEKWPAGLWRGDEPQCALRLTTLGQHMVGAALAAVAVGLSEGLSWPEIQRGLLAQGRGVRLLPRRGPCGSILLDDTYNASPASTLAALDLLERLPGRHLAVLGDMLELGAAEEEGHRTVGQRVAQTAEVLVVVGWRAQFIAEEAMRAGLPAADVHVMADNASASAFLVGILRERDVLLIKGSRGMGMEAIVQALEDRSQEDAR